MIFRQKQNLVLPPHQRSGVAIIAHGALALPDVAGGRPLAAIAIDSTYRPDLVEHVRLHQNSGIHDVKSTWAEVKGESKVCLILDFYGPTANTVILKFNLSGQLKAVDRILRYRLMYFMCGKAGDKISSLFGNVPSMIVEVTGEWPKRSWEKLLHTLMFKEARSAGLSRYDAKRVAELEIVSWRRQDALLEPNGITD